MESKSRFTQVSGQLPRAKFEIRECMLFIYDARSLRYFIWAKLAFASTSDKVGGHFYHFL